MSAVHGVEGEKVALEVSWSDKLGGACTAMLPLSAEQRDEIHEWADVGLVAPHSADAASVWAALSPKLRSRLLPAGWASATIKGAPSPPSSIFKCNLRGTLMASASSKSWGVRFNIILAGELGLRMLLAQGMCVHYESGATVSCCMNQ